MLVHSTHGLSAFLCCSQFSYSHPELGLFLENLSIPRGTAGTIQSRVVQLQSVFTLSFPTSYPTAFTVPVTLCMYFHQQCWGAPFGSHPEQSSIVFRSVHFLKKDFIFNCVSVCKHTQMPMQTPMEAEWSISLKPELQVVMTQVLGLRLRSSARGASVPSVLNHRAILPAPPTCLPLLYGMTVLQSSRKCPAPKTSVIDLGTSGNKLQWAY